MADQALTGSILASSNAFEAFEETLTGSVQASSSGTADLSIKPAVWIMGTVSAASESTTSELTVRDTMLHKREPDGYYGLDISSYQTITDEELLFSQIDFIYFRAYGSDHRTDGDTSFENFVTLAARHGVPAGAYYFGTPRKSDSWKAEAEAQAQQFIDKLERGFGVGYGDLTPMLDIEEYTDILTGTASYPMSSGMTAEELVDWILAFRDYFVANTKRALGFYTNKYFMQDQMGVTDDQLRRLSHMPLWLAEYDRWYPLNKTNPPLKFGTDGAGWMDFNAWQYEVIADANTYGVSSSNNEIDHNYTYSMEAIMPPKPPTDIELIQTSNNTIKVTYTESTSTDYIGTEIYVNGDLAATLPKGTTEHEMFVTTEIGQQLQVNVVSLDTWNDTGWSENKYLFIEDIDNPPPPVSELPVQTHSLYIFNRDEELVAVLDQQNKDTATFYDGRIKKVLNGEQVLTFTTPLNHPDAAKIEEMGYVAVKNKYRQWELFEITEIVDVHSGIEEIERDVTAEGAFVELENVIIENLFHDRKTPLIVLPSLLAGTRWTAGNIQGSEIHDLTVTRESVLSALQRFRERWGGELKYRVQIVGNKIAKRIIDFQMPDNNVFKGKRFEYSEDMTEIERTIDSRSVKTAFYGYGPEIENSGGLLMDFADIEWSIAAGDPADKPKGQTWVGDEGARAIFGKPLSNSTTEKQHLFGVYENKDAVDQMDLIWKTWVYAVQQSKTPAVSYKTKVIDLYQLYGRETESVDLGDYVHVIDKDLNIQLEARIVEYIQDLDYPEKDELTLGNYLPTFTDDTSILEEVSQTVSDTIQSEITNAGFIKEGDPILPEWLQTEFQFAADAIRMGGGTVIMSKEDGILIVDDPDNPQKAIKLNAGMLALADSRDIATNTFNWRSFGTGEGWLSDLVQTGFLRFERSQGGTLTLGGAGNGNGQLVVYDADGNVIGDLDATKGGFTNLFVGNFRANNVLNSNSKPIAFVVNASTGDDSNDGLTSATAFRTLQKAFNAIPKHNNSTVDIWVADGIYSETVYLRGFFGHGQINVYFQGAQMNGRLIVAHNNNYITLSGGYIYQGYGSATTGVGTLEIYNSNCVYLTGMETQSARRVDFGLNVKQSFVQITGTCKFYDATTAGINADVGGIIDIMAGCQGSGGYAGIRAIGTGRIAMHNVTTPAGTTVVQEVAYGGTIIGTRTDTAAGTPAVLETPPIYASFAPIKTKSWNSRNGWATENNYIYQGEWSTTEYDEWGNPYTQYWGNWKGCFFFDNAAINNTLTGRTLVSARLRLSRLTYGGYSGGFKMRLWALSSSSAVVGVSEPVVDYSITQNIIYEWGETNTITLPNWIVDALRNNSYGGFALYWPDGTNYMIFDSDVSLDLTYK